MSEDLEKYIQQCEKAKYLIFDYLVLKVIKELLKKINGLEEQLKSKQ